MNSLHIESNFSLIFKITFFFIILFSFLVNVDTYPGNKFFFFLFNVFTYLLFLVALKKNASYFELFFYILLILGFWFKFFFILYLKKYLGFEGLLLIQNNFELGQVYDQCLFVSIIAFCACIMASYLKILFQKKILKKTPKYKFKTKFKLLYKNNRFKLWFIYFLITLFIFLLNYNYKIYTKGLVNNQIPILLKFFFAWYFNYGLSVFTSILIFFDYLIFKKKKIIFIGFFETFFSNISILSRAFMLSFLVYLKGFFDLLNVSIKETINIKFVFKNIFFGCFIFIISFFIVSELRNENFFKKNITLNQEKNYLQKMNTTIDQFFRLSYTRWVGIDSLLIVTGSKEKNLNLFFNSFKEEKKHREKSFYMKNFFPSFKFEKSANQNLNTVILPGLIAFLYYSGSLVVVFFGTILFVLIFSFLESLFLYFSQNKLLCAIIGYALAMRLAHFGYLPLNTLPYIFSFLITLLFVAILFRFVWRN